MPDCTQMTCQIVDALRGYGERCPRLGRRRGHHPGEFWLTFLLIGVVIFSGCESANASESGRTYRPLHASCPTPPSASGDALQPAIFFDDEETGRDDLSDTESEELDSVDGMLALSDIDDGEPRLFEHGIDDGAPLVESAEHELRVFSSDSLVPLMSKEPSDDLLHELHALDIVELDTHSAPDPHAHHPRAEPASDPGPTTPTAQSEHAAEDDDPAASAPSPGLAEAPAPITKVNINTATEAELTSIRGIGPALAGRILDYRSQRPFTRLSHLKRVKGIGPATYRRLLPHITLEDLANAPESNAQN
ncbi:ComEA family DNA-binding protein [Lujinxingia sediminis]|nr:helix-hairpin-helix domain-containing protein [Lujinxingia sediminis]